MTYMIKSQSLYFMCHFLFFYHTYIIVIYSSLPVNNAPWSSRFNRRPCFTTKDYMHMVRHVTYNVYNENHHIFINHYTQRQQVKCTNTFSVLDI